MEKHFIQVKGEQAKEIFTEFGIKVKLVTGLTTLPPVKSPYIKEWKDEQGIDVFMPDIVMFKDKSVKITFITFDENGDISKQKIKNFFHYIFSKNYISYYDTYRKSGFFGYYDKNNIAKEKYREHSGYIEFDMTFIVPNGICFGFDNITNDNPPINNTVSILLSSGYANMYSSSGDIIEKVNQGIYNFTDLSNQNFVIVCPSEYNSVIERIPIPLGVTEDAWQKPLAFSYNKPMGF